MKLRLIAMLLVFANTISLPALESVPKADYHQRRVALAGEIPGGVAVLFAATEPVLDFMPYRQDEDFYYLTGWNEPGAAIVLGSAGPWGGGAPGAGPGGRAARGYRADRFLPMREMRDEEETRTE